MLKQVKMLLIIGTMGLVTHSFGATNDAWTEQFQTQFENSYNQFNSGVVAKNDWLEKITKQLPAAICNRFVTNNTTSDMLKLNKISNEKCRELMAPDLKQCATEYAATIPAQLDKASQDDWNKKMGLCVVEKFLTQYGNVSKTAWLQQFKVQAPIILCQSFINNKNISDLLKTNQIDVAKCETLIPQNLDQCITDYSAKMPAQMNLMKDVNWSNQIGRCTATKFFNQYGSISKAEWLTQVQNRAPAALCKKLTTNTETNKILSANNISYDKCLTLVPTSISQCSTNYSPTMPAQITATNESEWGKKMGKCTLSDFYNRYITKRS